MSEDPDKGWGRGTWESTETGHDGEVSAFNGGFTSTSSSLGGGNGEGGDLVPTMPERVEKRCRTKMLFHVN